MHRVNHSRAVGEHSCVAVSIDHAPGQTLTGLRWLHNDATMSFPSVLLLERDGSSVPDLSNTAMILHELTADELSWGSAELELPVTSSTGRIWAVFVFPANSLCTGLGDGGGPGIGFDEGATANPFYISYDGLSWVRFDPALSLQVVGQLGSAQKSAEVATLKDLATGVDYWARVQATETLPAVTATTLLPASPNPFNPRTVVGFELAHAGLVTIELYDARGRRISTLLERFYPAGRYQTVWDGSDGNGKPVASGVYYVEMKAGHETHRRKLLFLR